MIRVSSAEGTVGVAAVIGVVDARALDHQHVAFLVLGQVLDRRGGQFGQARLAARILRTLVLVAHVVRLEQAEDGRSIGGGGQLLAVPDVGTLRVRLLPFLHQAAAIQALADLVVILRVALFHGGEFTATAAEGAQRATAIARGRPQARKGVV
ncbi:hypothetical protein G6F62_014409 [Rhizopus arrhizus]|nr:hypothetical protein G6F62_014409 [Rhizopus arrhizus]